MRREEAEVAAKSPSLLSLIAIIGPQWPPDSMHLQPNDSEFCWRGLSGVKAQTFRSSHHSSLPTPKRAQTSAAQIA